MNFDWDKKVPLRIQSSKYYKYLLLVIYSKTYSGPMSSHFTKIIIIIQ